MKIKGLLFFIQLLFVVQLNAQDLNIKGNITDEQSGDPLIGVNIVIKDSATGAVSDIDGNFNLPNVPANSILVLSYVGYNTKEVSVENDDFLNIQMSSSSQTLKEFVITGYGKQEKKVATGAISKIDAKNIEGFKVGDVQSTLEGQISGLVVNESSGQPGSSKTVLIRGISTNGDNSPLFIVDGMQVFNIDHISPSDIESIDVLKDAASSAIYGARAANGVIIITTKKGTNDVGGNISYETFYSFSQPWRLPEMMKPDDYIMITQEKFENSNSLSSLENLNFPSDANGLPNTDWMDVIFDRGLITNHRLSANIKNAFVSLEYWDQNGVVGGDESKYERYSLRANTKKDINDFLTVGENLYLNRTQVRNIGINNAFGTMIADAFAYDPITDVYNEDKQFGFEQSQWVQKEYINPLSRLHITNSKGHRDQLLGNVYLEFEPIKGLTFRSDVGADISWYNFRTFTPAYQLHESFTNEQNDVTQGYGTDESFQFENYINYKHDIKDHSFDWLLGTSYRTAFGEFSGGSTQSIPDAVQFQDNWQYIDAGEDTTDLSYGSAKVEYHLISYFGRLQYNYKEKYLMTATLRRDGSSNFGKNNRWGLFPSASLGWVISKERFFNVYPISFLKLRASWGRNGNDRIAPLSYAATIENAFTYAFGQDQSLATGSALATPPNPDIKWEESDQIDIGLEMELLDGQVNFEADVYRKTTRDLLMQQFIPGYVGATNSPISNLGEIVNQGIELSLGYRLKANKFRINPKLTYTHFRNEVTEVAGETGYIQGWSWPVRNTPITRMTEGYPVGHFVGYQTDGIFQSQGDVFRHINKEGELLQPNAQPGDIRFIDTNKDGIINTDDIGHIGSPWPKHIFGLSLGVNIGGFDFSGILAAQLGHEIFRAYERSDITFSNYQTFWLERWTEENPSDEYPRLVSTDVNNNQRPSDFYLEKASFLRLKNLQIGYTLPNDMLKKMKMQNLRIYFSANNLFTVTNYKGFDPDIGTNEWILDTGIDKGFYPANRSVGLGLKVTF